MNRYCVATLLLSLTLAIGCQPQADDGEDPPAPTVTIPAPTTTTDESTSSPQATPAESSPSAAVPAAEPTPLAVNEQTPDAGATAEAEPEAPPTEMEFMEQLRGAMGEGNMDAALVVAEQAQAAFPDGQQWPAIRAQLLVRMGRVAEGMDLLKAAYEKDPENGQLAAQIIQMGLAFAGQAAEGEENGEAEQAAILDVVTFLGEMETAGRLETLGPQKGRIVEIVRYSEARVRATQGDLEAATQALKVAFAEGFQEIEMLQDDEAFADLLKQDDIAQMVAAREEEIRIQAVADAREELAAGESFPFHFALNDTQGNAVALEDYAGKILIVDFWGTWCPPCRKEIPHFLKLLEAYPDDLAIVGINYERGANEEENIELINSFAATMGIEYPCVLGDEETQDQVPNLQGFPTTLFVDRTGTVRLTTVGYRPYATLDAIISVLVQEKPDDAAADTEPVAVEADEPAADEPAADEPVADEPVADEPVADEPVAGEASEG